MWPEVMHLRGLDLNLLIILDVLLAERNVTRTGERVHLSQSATSGALSRLREFFDDQLLVQVGQRMELTPFAEMLVEEVHDIISKCEAIVDKN
ncbi:LysR family transcriptional regulator [Salmonella enterica]